MMAQLWHKFLNEGVSICEQSRDGLIALEKTCGILSHPNFELQASKLALFRCKYSLKFEKYLLDDDGSAVYLLNRLDAPVSGLILVALNEKIANAVKLAFERRTVEKKYLALLKGHLPNKSGHWKSKASKIRLNEHVRAENFGNTAAITKYCLIREISWKNITLSLVELQPVTGRTHQLRLHCSQNHVPIIGDRTYGDFNFNRQFYKLTGENHLFLHSNEICVHYKWCEALKSFRAKSKFPFASHCLFALEK